MTISGPIGAEGDIYASPPKPRSKKPGETRPVVGVETQRTQQRLAALERSPMKPQGH